MAALRSLALLTLGTVAVLACSSGPPKAPDAPPKKELVSDADATRSKANVAKNALQPFTVDWNFEHRKTLEKNVRRGAPVIVKFTEHKLAFLDGCSAPGHYVFSGYSPGRSFAQARNEAELDANFPLGAATLKTRLATEGSLVADLRPVGESSLDKPRLALGELAGGDRCAGATHVITKVMHGGFLFGSASAIEAAAKAGFMGMGAAGSAKTAGSNVETDGDLKDCETANANANEPPGRCSGVLQVYLAPLDAPPKAPTDKPTCPDGLRWNGNACAVVEQPKSAVMVAAKLEAPTVAPASNPTGFACDGSDAKDCLAQCKAGNARSCAVLGSLFEWGVPNQVEKDVKIAEKLYDLSCQAGGLLGCAYEAALLAEQKRYAKALELGKKACDGGEPAGCTTLAYQMSNGWGVPKDDNKAFELYARACKQREWTACNNAGVTVLFSRGNVKQDPPTACKMFAQACEASGLSGCPNLAICHETGIGATKDKKKALDLYSDTCEKGWSFGCVWGGLMVEGENSAAASKAISFYERACDYQMPSTCVGTADIMSAMPGVWSMDMIDRHACDGGDARGLACYNAGILYERGTNGVPKNLPKATGLFDKACKKYDLKKACRPAGSLPK
jgi:uncharacterized protein